MNVKRRYRNSAEFGGAAEALVTFKNRLSEPSNSEKRRSLAECIQLDHATVASALADNGEDPMVLFRDLGPIAPVMMNGMFDPDAPRRILLNEHIAIRVPKDDPNSPWWRLVEAVCVHEMAHYLALKDPALVKPLGFGAGDDIGMAVERHCFPGLESAASLASVPAPSGPHDADGFFNITESMPRGIRNHNPGNIELGEPWEGLATAEEKMEFQKEEQRFCVFRAPKWGLRALARLLGNYQRIHDLTTIRGMVNRWAPPHENDTDSYVRAVSEGMGISPRTRFSFTSKDLAVSMMKAVIKHENGIQPYSDAQVEEGYALAS